MNLILKRLRDSLQQIVEDIDAGNSNLTESELCEAIEVVDRLSNKNKPMTKYQAAKYLHVSRATFDNLVKDGKLPKGEKLYQGDSNIFWHKAILDSYIAHSY